MFGHGGLPLISKVSSVQRELLDFVIYRSSRKEISALKEQFNCTKTWQDCSQTGGDGEVWEYWGVAQNYAHRFSMFSTVFQSSILGVSNFEPYRHCWSGKQQHSARQTFPTLLLDHMVHLQNLAWICWCDGHIVWHTHTCIYIFIFAYTCDIIQIMSTCVMYIHVIRCRRIWRPSRVCAELKILAVALTCFDP